MKKGGITKNFELFIKALMTYIPMVESDKNKNQIQEIHHQNRDNLSNNNMIMLINFKLNFNLYC